MKVLLTLLVLISGLSHFSCNINKPKSAAQIAKERADSLFYAHPVYQVYGLPSENGREISQAAQLMGFSYVSIAGCEVNSTLTASVEANNRKSDSILQKKIGKNWEKVLYRKADSLFALNTIALKLAKSNPLVNKINHRYENHLTYIVDPLPTKNLYLIRGYKSHWADENHRKVFLKDHIKVSVDLKKNQLISIDTTTIITDTISLN